MVLFTPQTMVSFLISLHIQENSYVGYTWITLEVFYLKTQEVRPFSLLVKAETTETNEEACIYNILSFAKQPSLPLTWGAGKISKGQKSLLKKQNKTQTKHQRK